MKTGNDIYRFDSNKLLWHMERVHAHYKEGKQIAPLHIDIGATKMCNARCVYCYGYFQQMSGDIIPRDVLLRLFTNAPRLGVKSLTLTGDGEPTCNPAVYDAVSAGHSNGLDIGFATNGISLDTHRLRVLLNSLTWLRFNLSAVDSVGYKAIHGVPQWERVRDNILLAVKLKAKLKSKCTLGLQMVLIPDCLPQVIPEALFALKYKMDYFVIKQFSDPSCEEMCKFNLDWYNDELVKRTLRRAEEMSTVATKIVPKYRIISLASKGHRPYDRCVDCPLIFQISGNSKCYPCGYLFNDERYCYGDLKEQSLQEIIESPRYWDIVKYMRHEFDVHKDCVGCCRHDSTNAFMWDYLNPPRHLNFI